MNHIDFTTEGIQAILEGRKTRTRRIIDALDATCLDFFTGHADETDGNSEDLASRWEDKGLRVCSGEYPEEGSEVIECKYGKVGDIILLYDENGKEFAKGKITDIRVERVQEISEQDAYKEGCDCRDTGTLKFSGPIVVYKTNKEQFINLWNSIYAKRGFGWETNCWVWVIGFKIEKL